MARRDPLLMTTLFAVLLLSLAGCAREPALSDLVYEADDLPGCRLANVPANAALPCGMTGNPHVGAEPSETECFGRYALTSAQHGHGNAHGAGDALEGAAQVEALEEYLFSVYAGTGEAGVFGFRFDAETSARAAGEALRLRAAGGENGMVVEKGTLVAYIWYDEGASECGLRLRELVRATLE